MTKTIFGPASSLSIEKILTPRLNLRWLAVDCETTGLDGVCPDNTRDKLRTIQVWEGKKGRILRTPAEWASLKKDFEDPLVIKIIHSSEFDIPFIYMWTGILIRNVWDTKLMESVILGVGMQRNAVYGSDPRWTTSLAGTLKRRKIAVLDKGVRDTYGDPLWEQRYVEAYGKDKLKQMRDKYDLDDVKYLPMLMQQQIEDLEELDLMKVAVLENKCAEATAQFKINGIGFSTKKWLQIENENIKKAEEIKSKLPAHISWTSPAQVKKYFGKKGIQIKSYKDFWNPDGSTKKEWLGLHPHLDLFFELQNTQSQISKYGTGWLTNKFNYPTVHVDSRVRAGFSQIVSTGRYSCENPNLQQLPSKTKHRNAFVASKGCSFCIGDYTGQELGIMAAGAGEKIWIDAMKRGEDIHSVMGAVLHGMEKWKSLAEKGCTYPQKCECPEHKKIRRPVKDLNFGLAYGKGPDALAVDMGMKTRHARQLIKTYKGKTPAITKWLEKNGKYAVIHKETFTLPPFNRRRELSLEPEEWRRRNQGKNTPVQGTGGDILKLALVLIWEYICKYELHDTVYLLLSVHDEIITECDDKYIRTWRVVMKQLMEMASLYVTKEPVIKTDPECSKFWPYKDQDLTKEPWYEELNAV
jgi:DNA polymerase-1